MTIPEPAWGVITAAVGGFFSCLLAWIRRRRRCKACEARKSNPSIAGPLILLLLSFAGGLALSQRQPEVLFAKKLPPVKRVPPQHTADECEKTQGCKWKNGACRCTAEDKVTLVPRSAFGKTEWSMWEIDSFPARPGS